LISDLYKLPKEESFCLNHANSSFCLDHVNPRVSRDLGLGFQDDDDAREQRARDISREGCSERELRSQDRFAIHAILVARIACCSCVLSGFFFCVADGKVHQV
jgi:hypothetical protein